jgi:REP element-mobilizing transposase RayT
MADSYSSLYYHIVFSTKHREPWIRQDIEQRVWSFLGGIADRYGMTPLRIGGLEDHLHVVVAIPPTLTVSKAVQMLKGGSSRWVRTTFPDLDAFGWQDGYGAFTVSKSQLPATITYVEQQRERHETWSFQEEYRTLLERHGIQYDERYVLD